MIAVLVMAEPAGDQLPAARGLHFAVPLVVLAAKDALGLVMIRGPKLLRALPPGSSGRGDLLLSDDPPTAKR